MPFKKCILCSDLVGFKWLWKWFISFLWKAHGWLNLTLAFDMTEYSIRQDG